MTELYKKACAAKGIKVNKEVIEKNNEKRAVNSAKVELFNRQTNPNFILPPIKHPSMHPKEKPFSNKIEELMFERIMKKQKKEEETNIQKNAEANYNALIENYPASRENINIKFSATKMPDVFEREKHMAKRTVKRDGSA